MGNKLMGLIPKITNEACLVNSELRSGHEESKQPRSQEQNSMQTLIKIDGTI